MSAAAAGYLSALGVVRWRRRGAPAQPESLPAAAGPEPSPAAWQCLSAAGTPRLAFLFDRAPAPEGSALALRIAQALGVAEAELSLWAGQGDLPEALAALPAVAFGFGAGESVLEAPALSDLLVSPAAKASLWRELQARILPRL